MGSSSFFCLILSSACILLSVNCFANIQEKRIHLIYEQGTIRHSSLSRFRRQSGGYGGYMNYMQGASVQPSVVVIPSGVPPVYRGPGFSYGTSYGVQSSYGANRVPSVVVNMPDNSSCNKKQKKRKKILD